MDEKTKVPERIYLQCYDETDDLKTEGLFTSDITWCVDQINDNDEEYVLAEGELVTSLRLKIIRLQTRTRELTDEN